MAATKGLYAEAFLREARALGARVLVLTDEQALGLAWPRDVVHDVLAVRDIFDRRDLRAAVSYLARHEAIDRIVGLGEYDIELGADLREHLALPGIPASTLLGFRDKLAMRVRARAAGIPVPDFTGLFNREAIADFLARNPAPWLVKPRTEASSNGIQRCFDHEGAWRAIDGLGDDQAHHLLEAFVTGPVYHVDALTWGGRVVFAQAHVYGKPILELHREGGVFTTRRVAPGSADEQALLALNARVIEAFGLPWGATHLEAIQGPDGTFHFLEIGARVGAGMIEELVEATRGINLWAEWARMEVALARGEAYALPEISDWQGGVAITMAHHEWPDLSGLTGEGVSGHVPKPYHAALLVTGAEAGGVEERVAASARALASRFQGH